MDLRISSKAQPAIPATNFGEHPNGDSPQVGDFDGDGKADLCVLRPQSGQFFWYIRNSSNGQLQSFQWGNPATDPFPFFFFQIDIDNDGKQDAMIRRGVNGQLVFFVRRSSDQQQYTLQWGLTSFFPQFGDYDGDGRTDFASRQTISTGVTSGVILWHIFQSATQTSRSVQFGVAGVGDQRPAELLDVLPDSSKDASEF